MSLLAHDLRLREHWPPPVQNSCRMLAAKMQGVAMRLMLQVEGNADPYAQLHTADNARRVLCLVRQISDIRIEREFVDSAMLSFEDHGALESFNEIDRLLEATGLRRI